MVRGEAAGVVMRVRELLMLLLSEGRLGVGRGVGAPSGPFACSHLDFPEKANGEKKILRLCLTIVRLFWFLPRRPIVALPPPGLFGSGRGAGF